MTQINQSSLMPAMMKTKGISTQNMIGKSLFMASLQLRVILDVGLGCYLLKTARMEDLVSKNTAIQFGNIQCSCSLSVSNVKNTKSVAY